MILRWAMVQAARPRYASVLPPPVGKNSRSTISRSACSGSCSPQRLSRMKASWNGRHFGLRCADGSPPYQNRLALSRRARDRFVHGAEGEPRIGVRAQQFDAGRDPVTRFRAEVISRVAVACRGAPDMAGIPAAWLAIQAS